MAIESPLLETKLYVPKRRRGLVARARLHDRLTRGAESRLTLISAPAGFGKTTLLTEWLALAPDTPRNVAWLSLDPSDNQAAAFWPYLIASLQTVAPGVGSGALALLDSPRPPPTSTVLATLLNQLGALPDDLLLVLDDYHMVDAHEVQDGMAFLLDHLPPRVHVMVATRADPVLPLARWRARGELVEIRAADLRFTPDEAAEYLNGVMGLALTGSDVAALETRTEGWIAALQLAALSMQGREDVAGFIAGFAGDDRYIVDYLVDEVLKRQPERTRNFLLQTSILNRLSGPLCDAVTGQAGGKAMLEELDRANLFVVPLDDRRRWYRYQHLFADVVRTHLVDEQPHAIPGLHGRASVWFEQNGEPIQAIRHALAAGAFPRAADLIELALPLMRRNRLAATLLEWLEVLPDTLVPFRPVLGTGYVWALMEAARFDEAAARLEEAASWLDESSAARRAFLVVLNTEEFRDLPAMVALYRGAIAQTRGDTPETVKQMLLVLDIAPDDDDLRRGSAEAILGLAYWTRGDLEAAHRMFANGMDRVRRAGHVSDFITGAVTLSDFRVAQGRLRDAARAYSEALDLARHQDPLPRGTADVHVALAELARERDELDVATQHLLTSRDIGERTGWPPDAARWLVAMARVREAQRDLEPVLALLLDAERQYVRNWFFPEVRPVGAVKARFWAAHGHVREGLDWARDRGLSGSDEVSYLREFEHVALARVLLAGGDTRTAAPLLDRLLRSAEDGGRMGSVIEILVLQALAQAQRNDRAPALEALARALALAEPEGYVRIFVDEGRPIAVLLDAASARGIAPAYVRRLLEAFGAPTRPSTSEGLIEPLSERELDVLRLLASDLDGPAIARELVVSLHTVRSHTKSIYAKLGVNSRRAAVRRADELDLLSGSRNR